MHFKEQQSEIDIYRKEVSELRQMVKQIIIMKKLFTLLAVIMTFSLNAQLATVTEDGNTGQRLSTSNASNHGNIGSGAVDLSTQPLTSSTNGATGTRSVAMGSQTKASGTFATAMGQATDNFTINKNGNIARFVAKGFIKL